MSAHLDQVLSLLNLSENGWQKRGDPCKQSATGAVSDSEPNDHRTVSALSDPVSEVLVLGDNHGLLLQSILPYGRIIGFTQSDILNVLGFVAFPGKPAGQCRRQLSINDESHSDLGAGCHEDRVVNLLCRIFQAGSDVLQFKIGKIG